MIRAGSDCTRSRAALPESRRQPTPQVRLTEHCIRPSERLSEQSAMRPSKQMSAHRCQRQVPRGFIRGTPPRASPVQTKRKQHHSMPPRRAEEHVQGISVKFPYCGQRRQSHGPPRRDLECTELPAADHEEAPHMTQHTEEQVEMATPHRLLVWNIGFA